MSCPRVGMHISFRNDDQNGHHYLRCDEKAPGTVWAFRCASSAGITSRVARGVQNEAHSVSGWLSKEHLGLALKIDLCPRTRPHAHVPLMLRRFPGLGWKTGVWTMW